MNALPAWGPTWKRLLTSLVRVLRPEMSVSSPMDAPPAMGAVEDEDLA